MKIICYFNLLLLLMSSCNHQEKGKERNKIYIYSVYGKWVNILWYCYSNIGGFSGSKIDFEDKTNGKTETIESFYLSDINVDKDTLKLQLWKNDTSGMNISKIPCFKNIQIDTTGDQNKNGIDARISRIIDAKIDYSKPHNFDSRWRHY
jgi:hypothetical protein